MATDEAGKAVVPEQPRRYKVDYCEAANGPFYIPERFGDQIVVRINKRHPFFEVLYADLLRLPGGAGAKEAVDLLLITLARAELTAETPEIAARYATQRQQRWSPYLATAMNSLSQRAPSGEEQ